MNTDAPKPATAPASIGAWFRSHFARCRDAATSTAKAVAAATKLPDPNDGLRKQLLAARAFVARDGRAYPAGPCGYVPRSARLDPLRSKVRAR